MELVRELGLCVKLLRKLELSHSTNELMSMPAAVIRPARPGDLPQVLDLYRHLNPDDPQPDAAKAESAWSALMASDLTTLMVAEATGELVSTCTLVIVPNLTRGVRPYGLIENVVTHPGHRRTGLGQAVLSASLNAAWNADCYKVMLATGSRREETLRFYEKAGFKRGGKTFFEARPR
jgi:GNAT superfamily N-acetyltransferase